MSGKKSTKEVQQENKKTFEKSNAFSQFMNDLKTSVNDLKADTKKSKKDNKDKSGSKYRRHTHKIDKNNLSPSVCDESYSSDSGLIFPIIIRGRRQYEFRRFT